MVLLKNMEGTNRVTLFAAIASHALVSFLLRSFNRILPSPDITLGSIVASPADASSTSFALQGERE